MAINLFIALTILALLGTGMDRANEFTDEAIEAVKVEALFPNEDSTLSGSIIQRNVTDLVMFDKSNWESIETDLPNNTPPSKIANINVREKYNKDVDGISDEGKEIAKYFLSFNSTGEYSPKKMDQSGLERNNEYYFRYSINWFTILVTLAVIAFTLFSIALKLARLSFELTFNYILALVIAPADIHDGQKTKKILQSILNTFLVIILIFLSMKVYMIGTSYLASTLSTFPYLIALIAFSLAVVDGPNIVEKLFGIDAGLKSGWGVVAGAYAGSRIVGGATKGAINVGNALNKNDKSNTANLKGKNKPSNNGKLASPNDQTNSSGGGDSGTKTGEKEDKDSIAKESEKQKDGKSGKNTNIAPSPNDRNVSEKVGTEETSGSAFTEGTNSESSTSDTNGKQTDTGKSKPTDKPTSVGNIGQQGSHEVKNSKSQQQSTVQADTDNVVDDVEGTQNVNTKHVGGSSRKTDVKPTSSGDTSKSSGGGSHERQKSTIQQRSTVQQDIDIDSQVEHVQGTANTTERVSSTQQGQKPKRPRQYKIPNKKKLGNLRKNK